jgi:isoleucyl-tRNA synthetase
MVLITNASPWDKKFDEEGIKEVQRKFFFGTLYDTYISFASSIQC